MFVNAFIGSGANSISILFCFCGNKIFHINHKNFIVLIMYYICYKGDATEKIGINDIKLGVKEWIKKYKKFYPLFNTKVIKRNVVAILPWLLSEFASSTCDSKTLYGSTF